MTPPDDVVAAAQAAQKTWHIPASVSIAQWALESGWGAHEPGFNGFGIKAMTGYGMQSFETHECVRGHMVRCVQTFAKFADRKQAFDCHAKLLAGSRIYQTAFDKLPNVKAFVDAMAPHYATDPLYADKVMAVIRSSELSQYDRLPA